MAKKTSTEALIQRVRDIAMSLPGTSEKLSHGAPSFFVRRRMFFTVDDNHHGSGHLAVWCNAPGGAQEALVGSNPKHFFVPPYVGKAGWIGMRIDGSLPWTTIAAVLEQAHSVTGLKKKGI